MYNLPDHFFRTLSPMVFPYTFQVLNVIGLFELVVTSEELVFLGVVKKKKIRDFQKDVSSIQYKGQFSFCFYHCQQLWMYYLL